MSHVTEVTGDIFDGQAGSVLIRESSLPSSIALKLTVWQTPATLKAHGAVA